jgi:hypothetical protein
MIVWGGVWSKDVMGPFLFEDNVTSEKYRQMLKDNIISQLQEHPVFQTMIWQHDLPA